MRIDYQETAWTDNPFFVPRLRDFLEMT